MLPENQAAMLSRAGDVHSYATRSARSGLALTTRDHRSVGYRIPREWASTDQALRGWGPWARFREGPGLVFCLAMRGSSVRLPAAMLAGGGQLTSRRGCVEDGGSGRVSFFGLF